jgi:hypothetical protein
VADAVSDRERLLEGLVMKLMQEHGIDRHEIPSLMSCACDKCLIMVALYQMVAPMLELMNVDKSGRMN